MANTFKFGNENWATKKEAVLSYNDENNNFKPLPFTFDRASTATVVNSDGLIETVGIDEPRIDFLNNTKGHLLLEPSRQNSVPYSNDFNQHSISGGSITSDNITSPDGDVNSDTFVEDTANSQHRIREDISVSAGTYTMSVFVKGTDRFISLYPQSAGSAFAVFDIENATITKTGGSDYVDSKIENYGNGWYRCILTYDVSAGTSFLHIYLSDKGTGTAAEAPTYIGNGSEMSFYGLQIEAGTFASSYIPTSGSAVTRSVDTIEQSGFQGKVMNSTQGTIFLHIDNPIEDGDNNDFHMFQSDGSSGITDGFLYRLNTGTGIDILERVSNGTGAQFTNIVTKGQKNKIALSFTSSNLLCSGNGITKSYSGTYLGTKINIDAFGSSSANLQGFNIIDMKFYDTALTQEELNALTS